MTTLEVLKAAREKISDRKHWCQNAYENECGQLCAEGALFMACDTKGFSHDAFSRISAEVPKRHTLVTFNDTHTHAEVIELFDRAIAKLEAK